MCQVGAGSRAVSWRILLPASWTLFSPKCLMPASKAFLTSSGPTVLVTAMVVTSSGDLPAFSAALPILSSSSRKFSLRLMIRLWRSYPCPVYQYTAIRQSKATTLSLPFCVILPEWGWGRSLFRFAEAVLPLESMRLAALKRVIDSGRGVSCTRLLVRAGGLQEGWGPCLGVNQKASIFISIGPFGTCDGSGRGRQSIQPRVKSLFWLSLNQTSNGSSPDVGGHAMLSQ